MEIKPSTWVEKITWNNGDSKSIEHLVNERIQRTSRDIKDIKFTEYAYHNNQSDTVCWGYTAWIIYE